MAFGERSFRFQHRRISNKFCFWISFALISLSNCGVQYSGVRILIADSTEALMRGRCLSKELICGLWNAPRTHRKSWIKTLAGVIFDRNRTTESEPSNPSLSAMRARLRFASRRMTRIASPDFVAEKHHGEARAKPRPGLEARSPKKPGHRAEAESRCHWRNRKAPTTSLTDAGMLAKKSGAERHSGPLSDGSSPAREEVGQ